MRNADCIPASVRGLPHARVPIASKQQAFLEFVLGHYVGVGVDELDTEKLTPLLRLKYSTINDALADLGRAEEINKAFVGFQKYLYQPYDVQD